MIPVERLDRFVNESRPIVPDVRSNARPFEGRIYVLLLDNRHTAALRSALVKRAAHEFVDKYLGANDVAAVIHTSGATDASQEFTNDPRLLHASIDRFIGQKLRSRTLERLDEYNRNPLLQPQPSSDDGTSGSGQTGRDVKVLDPLDAERGYYARATLGTLRNLADFMGSIRGRRKAILMFSEGIDYPIYDVFDSRDASTILSDTRDAIAAASKANVNFYTIDPRGLHGMGDENMELGGFPADRPTASTRRRSTTSGGCRSTACRCWPSRPAASPPSRATTTPTPTIGSSARTAPTTCSATTRRAISGTAASTRSRSS